MRINKHDTNGTKPLLGKGELGYDDYSAGGDTGRVYVGTGADNIPLAKRLESNMMTKAQFNALAEERKANRAGSGFDEWGKHHSTVATYSNINEGMWATTDLINSLYLGKETASSVGVSKSQYPIVNINGAIQKIKGSSIVGNTDRTLITLPTSPNIYPYDTVLTAEQVASGVIKHADASNSGLIVNGKFDTDTSGWSPHMNSTLSWDNGKLLVDITGVAGGFSTNLSNIVVGKTYIIEFDVIAGTYTGGMEMTLGEGGNTVIYTPTTGRKSIQITALNTSTKLYSSRASATNGTFSIDNIAVYPADAISRSDLSFLESWHEDISEKNIVYPLGNVQYLGGNTEGLTGIANGAFTGFETYSLFGNWQAPSTLIGKGYVWSSLTEAQKRAFIANPDNNCYLDGDKVIQVRYRVRVVQGLGDSWGITSFSQENTIYQYSSSWVVNPQGKSINTTGLGSSTNGVFSGTGHVFTASNIVQIGAKQAYDSVGVATTKAYEGKCFALPIALASRRNQGMYHNVYNPNGTKLASDGLDCLTTTVSFNSISDCFDPIKLLTESGYIGTVSGRPDGLFYDQVHEGDILDVRNSSKKVFDKSMLISREFNKLIDGTYRGKEGEWEVKYYFDLNITAIAASTWQGFTSYKFAVTPPVKYAFGTYNAINTDYKAYYINGSSITEIYAIQPDGYFFIGNPTISSGYVVIAKKSTRTKSNTLLHCDIIGNPTNYPTAWKQSGVFGTPLIVAEDGTSLLPNGTLDTFKLSRKANATPLLCLRSTNNGTTWSSFTPTFSTTTNAITLTDEPAANLVMVYYKTHTSMAVPVVNSEVLAIGDIIGANGYVTTNGLASVANSLIGKTMTSSTVDATYGYWTTMKFSQSPSIDSSTKLLANSARDNYYGKHPNIYLYGNASPACKVFPYLTRLNGKAYLNLVFKEMKYNGTSWGDDSKFNIVDNVSTTTDLNAQTVLIGQKTVELPYFIAGDE